MWKSQEYYSIDNNKELFTLLKERMVLKSYWNISDGVSRLIDGRGEFSKSLDGKNENINRIINYTFNRYYRSLINGYDIKNNKIDFESYVDIGRYIKNPLDVYPVLFAPHLMHFYEQFKFNLKFKYAPHPWTILLPQIF